MKKENKSFVTKLREYVVEQAIIGEAFETKVGGLTFTVAIRAERDNMVIQFLQKSGNTEGLSDDQIGSFLSKYVNNKLKVKNSRWDHRSQAAGFNIQVTDWKKMIEQMLK